MKLNGRHEFNSPRQEVWRYLTDPEMLALVLPGCEKLEETGPNQYRLAMQMRIGPMRGTMDGKISISEIVELESYTIHLEGKGAAGLIFANGKVRLAENDSGTELTYTGEAKLGGRLASVGGRLAGATARTIIRGSLEGLGRYLDRDAAEVDRKESAGR